MGRPSRRSLEQRLADGVIVGAEGYVFELERRGYIKAGPYVPEVILDEPDALRQLHRELGEHAPHPGRELVAGPAPANAHVRAG